ncbi:MAG TPA: HAMP domain-containing sensor histidine kinase [Gaiellaceae bacterium]
MKRRLRRGQRPGDEPAEDGREAERGRRLVEESLEPVLVLDEHGRVVASSRRARELLPELAEGALPPPLAEQARVAYAVGDSTETLLYVRDPRDVGSYEELRSGFTAAVSHELRTPLARLLALLDSTLLPGADVAGLVEQARAEVEQAGELIDDVLFLSALETGREVVALGRTPAMPIVREVLAQLDDQASRAGVALRAEGGEEVALPLRPRMIRVLVENLAGNAIRYAGHGSTFALTLEDGEGAVVLTARDDGIGVSAEHLPRLFERFYRADPSRSSRGTGLGLAIVKHVVASAGGEVEAHAARGHGLEIRCTFPS